MQVKRNKKSFGLMQSHEEIKLRNILIEKNNLHLETSVDIEEEKETSL